MIRLILIDAIEKIDRHMDEYAYAYTTKTRDCIIEVREKIAALHDELDSILGAPAERSTRIYEYD